MKIKIIIAFITLIIISCSACKSSKEQCDAYGGKRTNVKK